MNLKTIFLSWFIITPPLFAQEAGSVNVFVTIPSINDTDGEGESAEQVSINTFYTANHQYYSLTPSDLETNFKQKPPLLEKALFELSYLLKGKCLALPLTIEKQKSNDKLLFSISEKQTNSFALLSMSQLSKDIAVKLYLIDLKQSFTLQNIIELKAGQRYPAKDLEGKTLCVVIPSNYCPADFKEHYLPLKVHYESL